MLDTINPCIENFLEYVDELIDKNGKFDTKEYKVYTN